MRLPRPRGARGRGGGEGPRGELRAAPGPRPGAAAGRGERGGGGSAGPKAPRIESAGWVRVKSGGGAMPPQSFGAVGSTLARVGRGFYARGWALGTSGN